MTLRLGARCRLLAGAGIFATTAAAFALSPSRPQCLTVDLDPATARSLSATLSAALKVPSRCLLYTSPSPRDS